MVFGEVVFGEVVFGEVVFGEVVFGGMVFGEVVFGEVVFGGMVFGEMVFRRSGFRRDGFRRSGFRRDGFRRGGFRRDGFRRDGFRRDGFSAKWFSASWFFGEMVFGEMVFRRDGPIPRDQGCSPMDPDRADRLPDGSVAIQLPPYQPRADSRPKNFENSQPLLGSRQPTPQYFSPPLYADMARNEKVYMPTTQPAYAMQPPRSTTPRHYDGLNEVYSQSGDTAEFARNMGSYLNDKVPPLAWFGLMSITCLVGFIILLIGAFNIPFCNVQPMIPIWLLVLGVLIIISSCVRIYAAIPMPSRRRAAARAGAPQQASRLSADLCLKGTELIFFLATIIWIILGCVWVYGSKWYVHFEEHMFEEHYCDQGLYWTAFSVCTGSLVCVGLIVVAVLFIMMGGAMRDS